VKGGLKKIRMRILKKIVPIVVTAMIGITMPMAFAQDLANWKGYFDTTAVVVGENAASVDNIGAVDIATSLSTTSEGTDTISGEAEKIEASNNKLNLNESFSSVEIGGFDDTELPTMLADGTFRADDGDDFDYTQKISFGATYPQATFKKDSDSPTPDEPALMVYGDDDNAFIDYTLSFTKNAASINTSGTLDDFEDSSIKMLGETYEIVNAAISGKQVTLELMTGSVKSTLNEGEEATYTIGDTTYTVKLDVVDDDGKAKFIVNGEASDNLAAGELHKFTFDIELGVTETIRQSWAGGIRQATFYLGAEKLKIEDTDWESYGMSDYVELDDENILDLRDDIVGTWDGTDFKISKIVFYWMPEEEVFVVEDNPTTFPGLGSFKVSTTGLTTSSEEEIIIEPDGNTDFNLIVPLENGIRNIDLTYGNGTGFLGVGKEAGSKLLTASSATLQTFNESVHEYFVASSTTAFESHIVKANIYNSVYNYVDFTDKDGTEYCTTLVNGSTCDIGEVVLTIHNVSTTAGGIVTFALTDGAMDKIYTKEGMVIYLPVEDPPTISNVSAYKNMSTIGNLTTYTLDVWEEAPVTETKETTQFNITLVMSGAAGSRESTVSTIPDTEAEGVLGYKEIGDTNEYAAYSNFATYWLHSKPSAGQNSVKIIYPGEEGEMNAYVAEETASIVSTGSVTGSSVMSYLDTEVDETIKAMNLIAIGGSAINSLTADLLGLDYPTYGSDEAWINATGVDMIGEALVKIMASPYTTGKYAMVVAGYEGTDTRRACLALKEGTPALSGDSVILSTVSEEVVIAS